MKQQLAIISILTAAALGLSSCADSSASDANTSPTTSASAPTNNTTSAPADASTLMPANAEFMFISATGTYGEFKFDGKPDQAIEGLRKEVDAPSLQYMNVKVDNREGTDFANMYAVTGFDADGKKYEFVRVSEFLDSWMEDLGTDDTTLYNRFVDANNAQAVGVDVAEVATLTLAHEGPLPESFTRVMVQAHGMDEGVDAFTEDTAPSN